MSKFEHLPVYKAVYTFSKEVYRTKTLLPKNLKHDLGSESFIIALKMLRLTIVANGSILKKGPLEELNLEIQSTWTFLRLMYDLKGMSKGQFGVLSEHLYGIQKQVDAWMAWEKKRALKEQKRK